MVLWQQEAPEPSTIAPLQTISGSESDVEEPSFLSRHRARGKVVIAGVVVLGVVGFANHVGISSGAASMGSAGVVQLDSVKSAKGKELQCAWGKQNCNASKCCNRPGQQCYEQTQWYAQCREACTSGPDPGHWDNLDWSCKELGERKEGSAPCSGPGEDCRESQCCSTVNTQCFKKNDDWATCKTECKVGQPDLTDADHHPWTCEPLGEWTHGAADWVKDKCSSGSDDCTDTHCCAEPGKQCFAQQEFFAQCKFSCPENPWESDWKCDAVGSRTPDEGGLPPGKLGAWVLDECVDNGRDCRDTKCCLNTNEVCYEKNEDWAMCRDKCEPGKHADDKNETWTCKELGPRLIAGLAVKGSPSLFCWSLFQTTTYEMAIMQNQLDEGVGIFQCDDYALLSTNEVTKMGTVDGKEIKTLKVEKAEITRSVDGTAGNAKLFMNCWEVIVKDGRWKQHAWIIKADPDAVIIPYRIRDHLRPHILENVYVVNCNAFPESPNFPMMYGSVEIYSFKAIDTYAARVGLCYEDMGSMLGAWGEDYYMTHCLDHIGVGRISDFVSVGDNVCSGGSCADSAFSAFHPYKDVTAWQNCWDYAHGKAPPPPAQQSW